MRYRNERGNSAGGLDGRYEFPDPLGCVAVFFFLLAIIAIGSTKWGAKLLATIALIFIGAIVIIGIIGIIKMIVDALKGGGR